MPRDRQPPRTRLGERLFFLARLALGIVFVVASVDKIVHPQAFALAVANYRILPNGLVNLTAIGLPWLELILGLLLILGWWTGGALILGNLLLAVFLASLAFNTARGLDISCGCFVTRGESSIGAWTLARDGLFLALGIYCLTAWLIRAREGGGPIRSKA